MSIINYVNLNIQRAFTPDLSRVGELGLFGCDDCFLSFFFFQENSSNLLRLKFEFSGFIFDIFFNLGIFHLR